MVEAAAAFVAWFGASLVVLSDGRRGLALGIALAAVGVATLTWGSGGPLAGAALVLGGLVAAAGRFRSGRPGWMIMPAGSTPRLVLCIAAGLLALWIAAGLTTGQGGPLRFAALVVTGLAGARVLGASEAPVLFTATGLLAFAVALAAALGDTSSPAPFLAAGIIAGGAGSLPARTARAA